MSKINLNEFEGHTPGPWEVYTLGKDEQYHVVHRPYGHVNLLRLADAQLIAAAPDLFAEVKRLRDRLDVAESYIIEPTLKRNYFADVVNKGLDDESDNLG